MFVSSIIIVSILIPLSTQQCLTKNDQIREVPANFTLRVRKALDASSGDKLIGKEGPITWPAPSSTDTELLDYLKWGKLDMAVHKRLLQSELQFSVDLLQTVGKLQAGENVLFSPTSVYKALLMSYFISANATESSLKKALHLPADKDKLDIFGAYTLEKYCQKLRMANADKYLLSDANRIYTDKKLKVNQCMKALFSEEIMPANFGDNAKGAVKKINKWVSEQTRRVIKDFIGEDKISADTELVVVNAAYFKGFWNQTFKQEDTEERDFQLADGSRVKTKMMVQENKFKSTVIDDMDIEALEMPYKGGDVSMVVLLPLKNTPSALPQLLARLDLKILQSVMDTLNHTRLDTYSITIPKFAIEHSMDLTSILESMGAGDLFKRDADLSTLVRDGGVSLTEATHKATLRVDELGTVAAAATAIVYARMGPGNFVADHPFVYFIRDNKSNLILFFGTYNSPEVAEQVEPK